MQSNKKYPQGSTYLLDELSWKFTLSQPYVGRIRMKTFIPKIFLAHRRIYLPQLLKTNLSKTMVSESQPAFIYSNWAINSRTKFEICSKLTIKAPTIILVSLLLTLNIFDTLFYFCWLWACKCRLEYFIAFALT